MKLQKIESFSTPQVAFVRLTAEDGSFGWGQTSPFAADITIKLLHGVLAGNALGKDISDVSAFLDAITRENYAYKYFGTFMLRALCGIDTALWDMRGRREGKPVCALLGGAPKKIPVYASGMHRDTTAQQEVDTFKYWRDEKGMKAYKYKIAVPAGRNTDAFEGRSDSVIEAMGKEFSDDYLIVDANGGYSPDRAIEVAHQLVDNGVNQFEEPCMYTEIAETAAVKAAGILPVSGGEQDNDLFRWSTMIDTDAVDIAQPDICYLGGLTRALEVIEMTKAKKLPIMPHSSNPSWISIFTAHIFASTENPASFMEYGIEDAGHIRATYEPFLEVEDGHIEIKDVPGWGVEPRNDWLQKSTYNVSEK